MYIKSLELKNYRNYRHEKIEFSPNTNIIYGNNAQGKTNLLEAIYIFSQGRSHRTKCERDLIKFDMPFAQLALNYNDSSRDYICDIRISKNQRKQISINRVPIKKLSTLMQYLNVVMFSPEDLMLVKGTPAQRRAFMDFALSQLRPAYLGNLITYYKVLDQKNALLKLMKRNCKKSDPTLNIWNMQLAELNANIMVYRQEFINHMQKHACVHQEILIEKLKIIYTPNINCDIIDKLELVKIIYNKLEASMMQEVEMASCLYGVHRDDLNFCLNNKNARQFASQGQQRSIVLSLKLGLADLVFDSKGEYPVMLLDDIMSELDSSRRQYLANNILNKQVLITCTDTDSLCINEGDSCNFLKVHDGFIS